MNSFWIHDSVWENFIQTEPAPPWSGLEHSTPCWLPWSDGPAFDSNMAALACGLKLTGQRLWCFPLMSLDRFRTHGLRCGLKAQYIHCGKRVTFGFEK